MKEKALFGISKETAIYLGGIGMVIASWILMQYQEAVGVLLGTSGAVMVAIIVAYGFMKCTRIERDRLIVALILIVFQSVFYALFEQQAASLTLLADQQFDRTIFGWEVKASQVQTMNTLFVCLLAPVMAWIWLAMGKRNLEPSIPLKFAMAMLIIGAGYIIFAKGLAIENQNGKNFLWLVFIYFSLSWAELFIIPVGLSMITKISVARIVGMMMGTWFLFMAVGNYMAGWISSLMGVDGHGVSAELDMTATMDVYTTIGMVSVGVGLFIIVLTPLLKKGMHGIR